MKNEAGRSAARSNMREKRREERVKILFSEGKNADVYRHVQLHHPPSMGTKFLTIQAMHCK